MQGVVAMPKVSTRAPPEARPATRAAWSIGPEMRGSLPKDTLMGPLLAVLRVSNHLAKACPMKKAMPDVRVTGSVGTPGEII